MKRLRTRFRVSEFRNPRTGSLSWCVSGTKKDGVRVRENYQDQNHAAARCAELEMEYHAGEQDANAVPKSTTLTHDQLVIAERAIHRLDDIADLERAVQFWLDKGRHEHVEESPRLDDALNSFKAWLDTTEALRDRSKRTLKNRVGMFVETVGNIRVADVSPEIIEKFLERRNASASTKDNDRRAVSRFFGWCIERPRRWLKFNPCREVHIEVGEKAPPVILTVEQCAKLLREAERFKGGRLVPYVAVCLFAGLRPFEASRLTWDQVNLVDGEIRLEAHQTKTGVPRTIEIVPVLRDNGHTHKGPRTLLKWLTACKGRAFYPPNWRKDFDKIKLAIGYGTPTDKEPDLKEWPEDVLRHTAISHFFRLTGSYGDAAEQFGNTEGIIREHYQSRVSSDDTKKFYAILPKKGAK